MDFSRFTSKSLWQAVARWETRWAIANIILTAICRTDAFVVSTNTLSPWADKSLSQPKATRHARSLDNHQLSGHKLLTEWRQRFFDVTILSPHNHLFLFSQLETYLSTQKLLYKALRTICLNLSSVIQCLYAIRIYLSELSLFCTISVQRLVWERKSDLKVQCQCVLLLCWVSEGHWNQNMYSKCLDYSHSVNNDNALSHTRICLLVCKPVYMQTLGLLFSMEPKWRCFEELLHC